MGNLAAFSTSFLQELSDSQFWEISDSTEEPKIWQYASWISLRQQKEGTVGILLMHRERWCWELEEQGALI